MSRPELNSYKAAKNYLSGHGNSIFPWQMDELRLMRSNCRTSKEYAQEKNDPDLYWVAHYKSKKIYHLIRGVNERSSKNEEKAEGHFNKFLEFEELERSVRVNGSGDK